MRDLNGPRRLSSDRAYLSGGCHRLPLSIASPYCVVVQPNPPASHEPLEDSVTHRMWRFGLRRRQPLALKHIEGQGIEEY